MSRKVLIGLLIGLVIFIIISIVAIVVGILVWKGYLTPKVENDDPVVPTTVEIDDSYEIPNIINSKRLFEGELPIREFQLPSDLYADAHCDINQCDHPLVKEAIYNKLNERDMAEEFRIVEINTVDGTDPNNMVCDILYEAYDKSTGELYPNSQNNRRVEMGKIRDNIGNCTQNVNLLHRVWTGVTTGCSVPTDFSCNIEYHNIWDSDLFDWLATNHPEKGTAQIIAGVNENMEISSEKLGEQLCRFPIMVNKTDGSGNRYWENRDIDFDWNSVTCKWQVRTMSDVVNS